MMMLIEFVQEIIESEFSLNLIPFCSPGLPLVKIYIESFLKIDCA
jgi:hypothetical protein